MRSYHQYCPLAKTLDVVGERWSLLIARELLIRGPCRYTDIRNGLPGVATNLLADRLRSAGPATAATVGWDRSLRLAGTASLTTSGVGTARGHPWPGLVGQRAEREALNRLLDEVGAGQSRVLGLRGAPGVGKTALLEYLADQASGCRVARAAVPGSGSSTTSEHS